MKNILIEEFNTPYNSTPFSKIKNEDFKPAFEFAIEKARNEINDIVTNECKPTFENTIEALEFSGQLLERVSSIFFNLNSAETNQEIQKIAQEVSPLLTNFSNDIILNEQLFEKVKSVYEQKNMLSLSTEQEMLLTKQYKNFTRNGANLKPEDKEKLRILDKEIASLKLKFGENVLAETNNFQLHIENENQLDGIPDDVKEAAQQLAEAANKEGWIFTLDYPSYIPFVTYAKNRDLRKKMSLAFGSKGFKNNENNNTQVVLKIIQLKHERAQILGYNSHAQYILEERMAENPENVATFLNDLLKKAKPAAINEKKQLEDVSIKDGVDELQKWDNAFYSEKLKKILFDFDDEILKPYFKLENVIQGVFDIANKLYDLNFIEINSVDKYHPDVKTYKVVDKENNFVALFYADFFPREGKRNGAWMTTFKNQWIKNNENSRPHISIVCNFTKPTKTKPSLLTFNEVKTLFHEFGHALHGMLANTTYPSLSGTNVYWDFVELPSQLFENWCYEEEALAMFAKHFETNEVIPSKLIEKIKSSSSFLEGMQTVRQLSFGLLDLKWHTTNPKNITDVKQFEKEIFETTDLFPDINENCMSTSFSHIFQGGYSAGYYSYKWAEVLDADAFSEFKEKGIFNKSVAQRFKENILSKGGIEHPMKLYKKFRGKQPTNEALLKRAGLIK